MDLSGNSPCSCHLFQSVAVASDGFACPSCSTKGGRTWHEVIEIAMEKENFCTLPIGLQEWSCKQTENLIDEADCECEEAKDDVCKCSKNLMMKKSMAKPS